MYLKMVKKHPNKHVFCVNVRFSKWLSWILFHHCSLQSFQQHWFSSYYKCFLPVTSHFSEVWYWNVNICTAHHLTFLKIISIKINVLFMYIAEGKEHSQTPHMKHPKGHESTASTQVKDQCQFLRTRVTLMIFLLLKITVHLNPYLWVNWRQKCISRGHEAKKVLRLSKPLVLKQQTPQVVEESAPMPHHPWILRAPPPQLKQRFLG